MTVHSILIVIVALVGGCATGRDWQIARDSVLHNGALALQACKQAGGHGVLDREGESAYAAVVQRSIEEFKRQVDEAAKNAGMWQSDKIAAAKEQQSKVRCPDIKPFIREKEVRVAAKERAGHQAAERRMAEREPPILQWSRHQQAQNHEVAKLKVATAKRDSIVNGPNGERIVEACEKIQDLDHELQAQASDWCDPTDSPCNERKIAKTKLVIRKFQQIEERFQRTAKQKFDKAICCDALPQDFLIAGGRCIAKPLGMYAH